MICWRLQNCWKNKIFAMLYNSPVGYISIKISEGFINEIIFVDDEDANNSPDNLSASDKKILKKCTTQLDEYFSGERKIFEFPIKQDGTEFQQKVWSELMNIPYGKTISYLQLAQRLHNVKAIRAAASANGRNMLSIIVPCHRVIGADGSLTGYGGGLHRKKWLLDHENKYANGVSLLF
jgi:methylated-DNA-[protein]-cysteine S-methyltransferase